MNRRSVVVLLALSVLLVVAAAGVAAVSTPRDQPASTTPPVRVFVGETLDVSAVQRTGGGTVGTGSVTLIGLAGDADGQIRTVDDPTDADFGDFETGTYDVEADGDGDPEFAVVEPRVTSVVVRNQNGANVTNGWEPTGEHLTVTASYNFEEADRLDLTVEDPAGLDVTNSVASTDRLTTSGGRVQLDLSEEREGTFRITLEGSALDDASRTVTVRTGPRNTAAPTTATTTRTETPTPTPTPTQTETPTPTPSATPTTATPTATETPEPTTRATRTSTPTTSTSTPTTSTSTPGFGVVVTLLALSLAVVCARWQR